MKFLFLLQKRLFLPTFPYSFYIFKNQLKIYVLEILGRNRKIPTAVFAIGIVVFLYDILVS